MHNGNQCSPVNTLVSFVAAVVQGVLRLHSLSLLGKLEFLTQPPVDVVLLEWDPTLSAELKLVGDDGQYNTMSAVHDTPRL